MGLNLTLGYAGQISLAQASFMGIGAYTTALMTLAGVPWLIAMPAGVALCFVIGLMLGFPALRVQGHFLAFVTLAFNTLFFLVARNEDWLTGGPYGLPDLPRPAFWAFDTARNLPFYYFTLIVFLASAAHLAVRGLRMWRTFRSFSRTVHDAADAVLATADLAEKHAVGLGTGAARLDTATTHLRASLERLAVLGAAARDARATLSAFRGAVPRK